MVVDVSTGGSALYREISMRFEDFFEVELDVLVLTHYHNRHISTIYKLLGDIRVRTIWLPMSMPEVDQDKAIKDEGNLRSIVELAERRRVEVRYYLPEESAEITQGLTMERLYYVMLKRSTHPTLSFSITYGRKEEEGRLAFIGASAWESEEADAIKQMATSSDVLMFSKHGPVIKSTLTLTDWSTIPKIVFFADGNVAEAIGESKEMGVVLGRSKLILGGDYAQVTLP